MTNSEAIKMLKSKMDGSVDTSYEWCECVRIAIKALEQEPCTDVISRQAAIDCLNADFTIDGKENMETVVDYINGAFKKIKALPSITPQQKVGKWIRIDRDKLKCSECEVIHYIAQYPQSANINYCPNCGTKMEEEEC